MSSKEFLCSMFIASVIFATCLLNAGWAVDASPKTYMTDVALSDGGTLQGQVVDLQNMGQPGVPIVLRSQNRDVAKTITNTNGQFSVQDLHGGVYNIATAQGENTFRLWAPRTAPPAAKQSAIVYVQNGGLGGRQRRTEGCSRSSPCAARGYRNSHRRAHCGKFHSSSGQPLNCSGP